tara:strand:+ start:90 stop:287 length:198 start_codon:yes stop_codon:yes gene_type:complete
MMKDKDFRKVSIKVMADADSGEADAVMSKWLKGQSGLLRADILQDAIGDLQVMYNEALADMRQKQ